MNDLSGFRPFSLRHFHPKPTPGIYAAAQLIIACQVKHLGFVEARRSNRGAEALADWIVANAEHIDQPKPSNHPLQCGTVIERILAGDVLPDEAFAVDLAEATEGAVLPEMFGLPTHDMQTSSLAEVAPHSTVRDGAASEPGSPPVPASTPTPGLPPLGALGGALPPGRLFHPIADARLPGGFVLTGCGVMLCLDESTAKAMRDALTAGIDHLRAARLSTCGRAAA